MTVSIRQVDFAFAGGKSVFLRLNLELGEASPIVILGPSGCGKTTLLRLIAGLLKPDGGEILCTGGEVPSVSMVFQEPRLLPWKTALDNVSLPIVERMGKKDSAERARHFLRMVNMEDKAGSLSGELSGGQQQRVNLARAFAFPGNILLMDEPFQSLDIPLRIELMDLIRTLLAQSPRLTVMVSHDPREAACLGRRIIVLGATGCGVIHDELVQPDEEVQIYGSPAQGAMERRLLDKLACE